MVRDVPTRWNSTYRMFNISQAYEKTFERYDLKEYEFRSNIENAGLAISSPSDWQHIRHLCHFLKPLCDFTERISETLYMTSNTCIEDIYSIRTLLDDAISNVSICDIALAMRVKFDKYFGDVEKLNLLLYFALILDPRNKVKVYSPSITSSTTRSSNSSSILGKSQNPDATTPKPPLRNKLREKMKTNIVESIGELEKYLKESVEEDSSSFNILIGGK
ncbi:zinc finger BED domain-containing protein DAYSLEEPER-like [Lactuca sativa]|uniref:zinc finger BED domain-containing protein DAYSLEEPER-like n=1 Tax=Lactuca sativa TaxID=4236 RepID=UPI000CD83B1F|nr:zinc finger BED domain-containing protein DAYSLEEPER-like [Lactuca sativa]